MNQHLQNILNFINRSTALSADEKNNMLEAVQNVHADLEHKNRDLEMEAALDRVRAVALVMKKPNELLSICKILFEELQALGFSELRNAMINIHHDDEGYFLNYDYAHAAGATITTILYNGHPMTEYLVSQVRKTNDAFAEFAITGNELKEWREYRKRMGEQDDLKLDTTSVLSYYFYSIGIGAIGISTYSPITEEKRMLLKRFRNVFDFAYRRYMDVAMAEAQAREAQIEAALERVRSKAMSMQKSEDLATAVAIIFEELDKLNLGMLRCGIGILHKEKRSADVWTTTISDHGKSVQVSGDESIDIHPLLQGAFDGWVNQTDFSYLLEGEDLNRFYQALTNVNFRLPESQSITETVEGLRQYYYVTPFQSGNLYAFCHSPFSDEAKAVMKRFAGVFDLTYTRFLDLKQAEAQAREAKIEAGLERVRSRTLAMHSSEQLAETASVVFKQMINLGIEPIRLYIGILKDDGTAEFWITEEDGSKVSSRFSANLYDNPTFQKIFKGWKDHQKLITIDLQGEELGEYFEYLNSLHVPFKSGSWEKRRVQHIAYFSHGFIGLASPDSQPGETTSLLERFAGVFNLTFARFNDLQVAEAQAIKAQIEEQKLREEKKRSDSLLLNILPEEIANELKQFGKSYARRHDEVTVLFADIKGFSTIAENLSPEELVNQLDECFRAFDHIMDKHGLEKIKTIGDAYVCACGLPVPVADHAAKTVRAAFDMMNFIRGFAITKTVQDLPTFEFRIGINTGPVVTGVVGLKKFTYDIWGDAVNLAARMEQHGEAGKINISGSTHALIKDKFTCSYRGKIPAKNKGEVDMYFVEGIG